MCIAGCPNLCWSQLYTTHSTNEYCMFVYFRPSQSVLVPVIHHTLYYCVLYVCVLQAVPICVGLSYTLHTLLMCTVCMCIAGRPNLCWSQLYTTHSTNEYCMYVYFRPSQSVLVPVIHHTLYYCVLYVCIFQAVPICVGPSYTPHTLLMCIVCMCIAGPPNLCWSQLHTTHTTNEYCLYVYLRPSQSVLVPVIHHTLYYCVLYVCVLQAVPICVGLSYTLHTLLMCTVCLYIAGCPNLCWSQLYTTHYTNVYCMYVYCRLSQSVLVSVIHHIHY